MKISTIYIMIMLIVLLLAVGVDAKRPDNITTGPLEDNDTVMNETYDSGTDTVEVSDGSSDGSSEPEFYNETETVAEADPESVEELAELEWDIDLVEASPRNVKLGDVLLNLKVENTGDATLYDFIPEIIGTGFTLHDVAPLIELKPGDMGEIFVAGSFSKPGDIILTIRFEDKRFYPTIFVESVVEEVDKEAEEKARQEALDALKVEIEELIDYYDSLAEDIYEKSRTHELDLVQIDDLRRYIVTAETNLDSGEVQKTNLSVMMAKREYQDQKTRLDKAPKRTFAARIKTNAQVIGAILGAIIASITLYGMFGRPALDKLRKKKAKSRKRD